MIQITYQRGKCIGCNYCIELAPERWRMNKKDGRSLLLGAKIKKDFTPLKSMTLNMKLTRHQQEYAQ